MFSAAKDVDPGVWYSHSGERIGHYTIGDKKSGVAWSIDCDWSTTKVCCASSEALYLWDAETGESLATVDTKNAARSCSFGYSGNVILFTTDNTMGFDTRLCIIDIRDPRQLEKLENAAYLHAIEKTGSNPKVTCSLWGPVDKTFITGNDNGNLTQWDARVPGEELVTKKAHAKAVTDMQSSADLTLFITSSKDQTAKLFDIDSLDELKTYKTDRPMNSAAISPIREHVVVGGGQEAMEVTTGSAQGKFEARFFHMIYEEEFASVKGHFGPINTLAFHPDGRGYASGGEDGYVRVHRFDPEYFEYNAD
ncbi:Eukaryotic translation initiation factor 3 subunit I, partial [Fragariocoptes setiger]